MEVLTKSRAAADVMDPVTREGGLTTEQPPAEHIRETAATGEATEVPPTAGGGSHHRKITFARLATCILNVERARKKSVSKVSVSHSLEGLIPTAAKCLIYSH